MHIAIDPGHGMSNRVQGVYDPGACKKVNGVTYAEADIALDYALTLKRLCVDRGIEFFLTRTSSADPAPVTTRAARARKAGCTHFISLHLNSSTSAPASGLEVLYRSDAKDKPLAAALQQKLIAVTGFRDRGIKERDDLAVLKFTSSPDGLHGPAVLIELGFISNESDREYLLVRENRIEVCEGIVEEVV